ncbi:type II toxin-antitoxin system antitoxin SocA domain-containing protein [Herbidospora cretacea]|uniref:type II toxin-antitoxin system antitoxin SocA domain-containing protein n=1 Tax=Herbidospora cretacea TaxID=28444 RepID=UPI001471E3E6|nr:type II toxin-antitoxin system antitoxin SocA domain-containing protein [Herbidospora cretacea]
MPASAPLRGPAAAVAYLLATARTSGMRINRTKLAKLLYLADLRAVERGLPPASGVEWRWRDHGPHSFRLAEVERDLSEAGVLEVEESADPFAGHRERVIHLIDAPQTIVDDEFAEIIDDVLSEYGRWSAGQLRSLTYQTRPMQMAIQQNQREVRLDLAGGAPFPDLNTGLDRLRRWADRNPLPEDEPGGIDDLVEESSQLAEHRAEATRHLMEE